MKKIIEGKLITRKLLNFWEPISTYGETIIIIAGKNCTEQKKEPIFFMERAEP